MRRNCHLQSQTVKTNLALPGLLVSVWLAFVASPSRSAVLNDVPFALMTHRAWTAQDGAPQAVQSLAQDPDGTLWLGTEAGLFNFDGRTFKMFHSLSGESDAASGDVEGLTIARDGALWGATLNGAVRIKQGHLTHIPTADGKRLGTLIRLVSAGDGSVWGFARTLLVHFESGGETHLAETPLPVATNVIGGLFIDSGGTLWLSQGGRLYQKKSGESSYFATDTSTDFVFAASETDDGSLWVTDFDTRHGLARHQHIDRTGKVLAHLADEPTANSILHIGGGTVFLATQADGLHRFDVSPAASKGAPLGTGWPVLEKFTRADGLTGDAPSALLLDRDENLWVANLHGLDRFRAAELVPFPPSKSAHDWKICSTLDGDVWLANSGEQLYKVSHGISHKLPNTGDIYDLSCGHDGDPWMVDKADIRFIHAQRAISIPPIPGAAPYGVTHLGGTADHVLYAGVGMPAEARGIWRFKEGQWSLVGRDVQGTAPQTVYVDSKNRIWAGYRGGLVAMPLEGADQIFSSGSPGLDIVLSFIESPLGFFVSGTNGLAVFRGDRFEMLRFADPEAPIGMGGLINAKNGDLWLNGARGVVRVRASELKAAVADSTYAMQSRRFTEGNFVGPVSLADKDTTARDADGNLWFATFNGVFHLDPDRIDQPPSRPPIVSLQSMAVDGTRIEPGEAIGPNPRTLTIQYLGANLTSPADVIYRYRLKGLDDSWQDVGHRSEAIYTQLPPGSYTFQVMASNGDGTWTAPVSSPAFTIAPAFNQTVWFKLLAALAGLMILFGALVLRVRVIARGIRKRAEERADERIRIARDLHDTLLQGVQGLLLNVHVAAAQTPDDAPSKQLLRRALSSADNIIIEGRDRVSRLRADHLTDAELIGSIESVGRDLATADSPAFTVRRSGTPVALHAHVADETFQTAREALTNAFRHAKATQINVEIVYGLRFFTLSCEDNGCGFSRSDVERRGHWGIKGMVERAARLGGNLTCRSEPLRGTTIRLDIPSYRAYRSHSRLMFYLRGLMAREPASLEPRLSKAGVDRD